MLFQAQIQEHQQLAEHYRNLAAQREAKAAELVAIEQEVMGAVQTIKGIQAQLDPATAATLQSQILNLLGDGGDGDGGGGGEPIDNTETTNGDGRHYQTAIDFNHYHLEAEPAFQGNQPPEASGNTPESTPENLEREASSEPEKPAFTEFVEVSDRIGYLKIQHSGEIKAVYAGFSQKQRAESWGKWLAVRHEVASGFEVRAAKHLPFKWELKLWGLNINQINRLASENLTASPHTQVDSAKPPSYQKPNPAQISPKDIDPAQISPKDIVTPIGKSTDTYEVVQIMHNGILDCKSIHSGTSLGLRPSAVTLVSKSNQEAKAGIIEAGNSVEVKDPTDGESRTGIVQGITKNPLAPIVVVFEDGSTEEFYRSQVQLLNTPAQKTTSLLEKRGDGVIRNQTTPYVVAEMAEAC